ncbi:hypothetical protein [Vibrio metoecus]
MFYLSDLLFHVIGL